VLSCRSHYLFEQISDCERQEDTKRVAWSHYRLGRWHREKAVMRPNEQNITERRDSRRGGRFELFFYEQVGTRYYLRFTRLALVLVVCLTVVPAVAILALFLTHSRADLENVNINVRVAPRELGNYPPLIQQPPAVPLPTPRKASRSPRLGEPGRQTLTAPALNANAPLTPSPTPSPTPPRLPG
jgi:hypothetical protein